MKPYLIKTLKKIKEFLIIIEIFSKFIVKQEIYCNVRFEKKKCETIGFFCYDSNIYICGTDFLIKSKKQQSKKNDIILEDLRKNGQKKKKEFKRVFLRTIE